MMKKLDRRVARTRRLLNEALVSLSLEKSYGQITIRDLTRRANVGYATFFRHYRSKDELLTQYARDLVRKVRCEINPNMSRYEESLVMYRILEKHQDVCRLGISLPRDHPAMKPVGDEISQSIIALYEARDETVIPLEVSVNHLICSVKELIRWWLHHGQAYCPEQMATMQNELIVKVTESVALDLRTKAEYEAAPSG